MAFQASLTSLVSQQLGSLLQQVCQDYHLDAAEVIPRYLEGDFLAPAPAAAPKKPRAPKAPKVERPPCAHEVRGQPCKHKAREGDTLCHIHIKQRDNPKAPAPPKRICRGTTSKGALCTVKAQEGCDLCHLHMAKANAPPKAKPIKKPAKKSQAPQVEGRGESPPPVFCQPCLPVVAEDVPEVEPEDEMEDLQKRLAAIMTSEPPEDEKPQGFRPTLETLEAHGFSDDPEDWDPEQMESPHSQEVVEKMQAFQEDNEFMEE